MAFKDHILYWFVLINTEITGYCLEKTYAKVELVLVKFTFFVE